jgi:hypothetical protein
MFSNVCERLRPAPGSRACPTRGCRACPGLSHVSYTRMSGLPRSPPVSCKQIPSLLCALVHVLQPGLRPASRLHACPAGGPEASSARSRMSYSRALGLLRVFTCVLQAGPRPPPRARACPTTGPRACFPPLRMSYNRVSGLSRVFARVFRAGPRSVARVRSRVPGRPAVCRACSLACSGKPAVCRACSRACSGHARGLSCRANTALRAGPRSGSVPAACPPR